MIKVKRVIDYFSWCDCCGDFKHEAFFIEVEEEIFPTDSTVLWLCEKCTAELKEKIGRFIY
ncbi:hypothetical protein [Bacillus cereus]|uniref:hypothetical protein n=1 Tax=Bacillus cereus TaxID=1396 RepID=UPI002D77EC3D|nr:hypothetical protein [Bacillus cereus]